MNFKLKALVAAAVATITMSGAANALTNNEIFLVANDTTGGVTKTFIAALGQAGSAQAFTGTSNLAINYSADANWANFIAGTSNVTYQVLGLFQSDATRTTSYNAADKLLVSSLATPGKLTNNSMNSLMANGASSSASFGGFEFLNAAVTGTSTGLVVGTGADGIGAVSNNVFNNYLTVNTQAALGQDLGFYSITRPVATGGLTAQVVTQYTQDGQPLVGDVWNLSSTGKLTYTTSVAAVPEADTSAMMLLGLGLMGFIARRRTRA
jgi:hypothetical protein